MLSGKIRLGVVGLRNNGSNHVRLCADLPEVDVAAISDTDPDRLQGASRKFAVPRTFDDPRNLFACPDLDGVVLSVPNALHASLAMAALEAGKHVLVEKPMARTVAEADAMIAARDRAGRVLMVGMNQRFSPRHAGLRKAIADGALGRFSTGRTYWLQCRPHDGLWGRGDWFLSREAAGGGPLLDLGIHRLDLALFFLGYPPVASVTGTVFSGIGVREAAARGKQYDIEDGAVGFVRFQSGAALELAASYFQNTPVVGQGTLLCGDRGSLHLEAETPLLRYADTGPEPVTIPPAEGAARSCVEHFARVLRGHEPLSSTAEQGREALRIVAALYTSAANGREVSLA